MYHFGANILFRIYNDPLEESSPQLIAEYASCLAGAGNYIEAQNLFSKLPDDVLSDHVLSYSDSLFRLWESQKANEVLERFAPKSLETYADLVYGLNLAASHIVCDKYSQAEELLTEIKKKAHKENHNMIYGNSLELFGQIHFSKNRIEKANQLFKESERLLRSSNNLSWLFSLKWATFSTIELGGMSHQEMSDRIDEVRKVARQFLNWETLRECDLYEAVCTDNQCLFNRVYFATPHRTFREKALRKSQSRFQLNSSVQIGPGNQKRTQCLDLNLIEFHPFDLEMSKIQKILLKTVTKDLYSPIPIYQLFYDLFPGEFFNPLTSKDKTYKQISKLRSILELHPSQLRLDNLRNYGYRFRSKEPLTLIYPLKEESNEALTDKIFVVKAQTHFGSRPFSRKEFSQLNDMTDRSASRILKHLEESGDFEKVGQGRSTKYKVAS